MIHFYVRVRAKSVDKNALLSVRNVFKKSRVHRMSLLDGKTKQNKKQYLAG